MTKLDAAGSALVYSSFLGGTSDDSGNGIVVDTAGNAYVTGSTISENFPTTVGAFDTTYGSPFPAPASPDGFVAKIVHIALEVVLPPTPVPTR